MKHWVPDEEGLCITCGQDPWHCACEYREVVLTLSPAEELEYHPGNENEQRECQGKG